MKNEALLIGLFLLAAAPLYGQRVDHHEAAVDSVEISIQLLLSPSVQSTAKATVPLKADYLFDSKTSTFHQYLNLFNSAMTKLLLAQASDNFSIRDYPTFNPTFYRSRTAFQYNFKISRTQLYHVSDLQKASW